METDKERMKEREEEVVLCENLMRKVEDFDSIPPFLPFEVLVESLDYFMELATATPFEQYPLNHNRVRALIRTLIDDKVTCKPLVLAPVDGVLTLIGGRHRIEALKNIADLLAIPYVKFDVVALNYYSVTTTEQAVTLLKADNGSRTMSNAENRNLMKDVDPLKQLTNFRLMFAKELQKNTTELPLTRNTLYRVGVSSMVTFIKLVNKSSDKDLYREVLLADYDCYNALLQFIRDNVEVESANFGNKARLSPKIGNKLGEDMFTYFEEELVHKIDEEDQDVSEPMM